MTGDSPFTRYGKWLALPRGMLDAGDIRARLDYEAAGPSRAFPGALEAVLTARRCAVLGLEFRKGLSARRWLAEDGR
jgi:hypothetical protein